MSDPQAIELVLQRFLDNREGLSDEEFAQLLETLRTQPAIAELLKDHLLMDELLAQQFQMNRKDFIGKFEARLREENGHALRTSEPANPPETYALRWPEPAESNGGSMCGPSNQSSQERPSNALSTPDSPAAIESSTAMVQDSSGRPGRTLIVVFLGLVLVAGGFLWLEYTNAARSVGKLEEVTGMAFIYRGDVGIVAANGMAVLPGDEIRVQEDASVSLEFRDQSRTTLAANSRAVFLPGQGHWPGIIAHEFPKEASLLSGRMDAWIEPQRADRPLRLQTPQFRAKVMGTRLIVTADENQSRLEVLEGQVEVESIHQSGPPLEIAAGHQVIASDGELRAAPGDWPIDKTGLAFLLSPLATVSHTANQGVQLFAEGLKQTPAVLRPREDARFEQARMVFRGGAFLVDDSTAAGLLKACQDSNQISIEATFQTVEPSPTGAARWISFSTDAEEGNFALEQRGNRLVLRLLTSNADGAEIFQETPLFEIPDDLRHHVVVTYSPGDLHCYLDGEPVDLALKVEGTFAAWKPEHFLFGDEWTGGREWQGQLSGVAVYHRAITTEEAARNALHFRLQFPPDTFVEEHNGE